MANRLTTAQFGLAMRNWGPPAIVALAAMAALVTPTADAAARQFAGDRVGFPHAKEQPRGLD